MTSSWECHCHCNEWLHVHLFISNTQPSFLGVQLTIRYSSTCPIITEIAIGSTQNSSISVANTLEILQPCALVAPISPQIFLSSFKFSAMFCHCNSITHHISTNIYTCYGSTAVTSCAKFHSDQCNRIWMRTKWYSHWIWTVMEKSSMIWGLGLSFIFATAVMYVSLSYLLSYEILTAPAPISLKGDSRL